MIEGPHWQQGRDTTNFGAKATNLVRGATDALLLKTCQLLTDARGVRRAMIFLLAIGNQFRKSSEDVPTQILDVFETCILRPGPHDCIKIRATAQPGGISRRYASHQRKFERMAIQICNHVFFLFLMQ